MKQFLKLYHIVVGHPYILYTIYPKYINPKFLHTTLVYNTQEIPKLRHQTRDIVFWSK